MATPPDKSEDESAPFENNDQQGEPSDTEESDDDGEGLAPRNKSLGTEPPNDPLASVSRDTASPAAEPVDQRREDPPDSFSSTRGSKTGSKRPNLRETVENVRKNLDDVAQQQVNIIGDVLNVGGGIVGYGSQSFELLSRPSSSYSLTEIAEVLSGYFATDQAHALRALLLDQHLLFLHGDRSTGKQAAALWLLSQVVPESAIVHLDPTQGLDALSQIDFKESASLAFLVANHSAELGVPEPPTDPDHIFEIRLLRDALTSQGAYMVVTQARPIKETASRLFHPWQHPDPFAVFAEHCQTLGFDIDLLPDGDLEFVREQLSGRVAPWRAASMAHEVAASKPVREATLILEREANELLRSWFEQDQFSLEQLCLLVSLAFIGGAARPTIERAAKQLYGALATSEQSGASTDGSRDAQVSTENGSSSELATVRPKPRQRTTIWGDLPLIDHTRVPRLKPEHARAWAIAEFRERYAEDFWNPTRIWLLELPNSLERSALPRLAEGLAELIRQSPNDVHFLPLRAWAMGTSAQQATAALTLDALALLPETQDLAFHFGDGWARSRNLILSSVGISALSGTLAVRFPRKSVERVWDIAGKHELLRDVLCGEALVRIYTNAVVLDRQHASAILRFLMRQLTLGGRRRTFAHYCLSTMLSRAGSRKGSSAYSYLHLIQHPQEGELLAGAWAKIVSTPKHRSYAIKALCKFLEGVPDDEQGRRTVSSLGSLIRNELSEHDFGRLNREITHYRLKRTAEYQNLQRSPGTLLVEALLRNPEGDPDE